LAAGHENPLLRLAEGPDGSTSLSGSLYNNMRLVIHQIQGMLPLREALDVLEHNAVQVHADGIVNEQGVLYVDDDAAGRVVEILAAIGIVVHPG
jgi:hypothetical protein